MRQAEKRHIAAFFPLFLSAVRFNKTLRQHAVNRDDLWSEENPVSSLQVKITEVYDFQSRVFFFLLRLFENKTHSLCFPSSL